MKSMMANAILQKHLAKRVALAGGTTNMQVMHMMSARQFEQSVPDFFQVSMEFDKKRVDLGTVAAPIFLVGYSSVDGGDVIAEG